MPQGRPDWYNAGKSESVSSMEDMGELAVRLGCAVNYDRTGKVIWADDFTHFDALYQLLGAGIAVNWARDVTQFESGDASLSGQLNAGAANWIGLMKYCRGWQLATLSLEVAVCCDWEPDHIYIQLRKYQPGEAGWGQILVDVNAGTLSVQHDAGAWSQFATPDFQLWSNVFYMPFKVDIDLATMTYVRFRAGESVYDISDYNLVAVAPVAQRYLMGYIYVYGNAGNPLTVWLDRFIFTEDI